MEPRPESLVAMLKGRMRREHLELVAEYKDLITGNKKLTEKQQARLVELVSAFGFEPELVPVHIAVLADYEASSAVARDLSPAEDCAAGVDAAISGEQEAFKQKDRDLRQRFLTDLAAIRREHELRMLDLAEKQTAATERLTAAKDASELKRRLEAYFGPLLAVGEEYFEPREPISPAVDAALQAAGFSAPASSAD